MSEESAAVGADAVALMKGLGPCFIDEVESLARESRNEVDLRTRRAHQDRGAGTAVLEDELPFLGEGLGTVRGHPVLMIEEDVMRIGGGMLAEEVGDRAAVCLDAINPISEYGLMLLAKVVRAALAGVAAAHVNLPEVVFPKGDLGLANQSLIHSRCQH